MFIGLDLVACGGQLAQNLTLTLVFKGNFFKKVFGKRSASGRRQGPCGQVWVGSLGMWSTRRVVQGEAGMSMLTPCLSTGSAPQTVELKGIQLSHKERGSGGG